MSQNDFNLANQGFPAMRADMNSAFQALASNSSGTSAPSVTYPYQWWYDETTDILKQRNGDNDAWINIAAFDQVADTWSPYVGADALVRHLTAAWEAGTATEPGVPSPAQVKAAIEALVNFSAIAADLVPDADSTRDLGSSTIAWALAYLDAIEPVGTDTTIKRVGGTNTTPIVEGIAKAWVNFDGTGTIAARDSLNVSSLTDNGTGDYTVNFSNAFGAADYAATLGGRLLTTGTVVQGPATAAPTVSAFRLVVTDFTPSIVDAPYVFLTAHGDLA